MFKNLVMAAAVTMACAGSALAAPVLTVGTEPTFQPFEFVDARTKDFVGYDMDMIRAAAKHMGYQVKFVNMGFDGLIPALMTNNIDAAAAGMTITAERKKKVDFTRPVYQSTQVILVNKSDAGSVKSEKDLKGKNLCAQIGTVGAEFGRKIPGAKVKAFNTLPDTILELNNRGCTAVIADKPVVEYFLKQRGGRNMVEVQTGYPKEEMAFAVRNGNKKLLDAFNKALAAMDKSGETAKIHQKWFSTAK